MFKEYEVTVDLDNDACPFVITNIPVCLRYYDDRLTEDEIKGKPLRILKADQEFWNNLGSGWLDAQISPEIIKALRGEESNWKLVRCIFRKKVAQLWLVNPKTYHRDGYILAEDYADELNTGRQNTALLIGVSGLRARQKSIVRTIFDSPVAVSFFPSRIIRVTIAVVS